LVHSTAFLKEVFDDIDMTYWFVFQWGARGGGGSIMEEEEEGSVVAHIFFLLMLPT